MRRIRFDGKNRRIALMAILLATCCFLTYYFHALLGLGIIFAHFFYVPIILACIWWKRTGLLVAVFLAAVLILSHLLLRLDVPIASDMMRAGTFIVVASATAWLSERLTKGEKALRETLDYLENLFNYANAPIIVWNAGMRITRFNHAFERLTGHTADEVIGQQASMLFPEASREESLSKIAHVLDGDYWESVEIPILRKDGDIRLALWNSANIHADGSTTVVATIAQGQDITERKQAQERIDHLNLVVHAMRGVNQLITREKDRDRLLKSICTNLIKSRGYHNAWIALLDESGGLLTYAEAGLGTDFLPIVERLKRGDLVACGRKALGQSEVVVTEAPASSCSDCLLAETCLAGTDALTVRVGDEGKVYGFLVVSLPRVFTADEEEHRLFQEVAEDITLALHSIELKEAGKQAEEALRESEHKFRSIIEQSHDGIVLTDVHGTIIEWNRGEEQITGLKKADVVGLPFWDVVLRVLPAELAPPEVYEQTKVEFSELLKTGRAPWLNQLRESTIQRPDGTRVVVEETAFPIKSDKGLMVGTMSRDITERKQAEEALQESEEKYRSLVENATEAIAVAQDGMIKFANPKAAEMTGYSIEELMSMPPIDLIHPDDRELAIGFHFARVTGEEVPRYRTFRVLDKEGNVKWVERSAGTIPWEGKPASLIIDSNVTERKLAEKGLQESEEKLRQMFDAVTDTITVTNLHGVVIEANERIAQMHGFGSKAESLGKSAFEFIAPEDRQRAMANMQETAEEGAVKNIEYTCLKTDGSEFPVELSASVLKDASGNPVGFVAITRDITERKRAEEERRELEQKAQLGSRLASVGEMASGIAHEINNPLTGVIGYSELLMQKDITEDMREGLEVIHDGGQRVADIIKRLLTFARQTKAERELVSINDIIANTLALRSYELQMNNVNVTTYLDPDLPAAVASTGELQQVFLNLVINAETEMKLAHGKGNLSIRTEKVDNTIRISFKDDGPGIAKENLDRIFDPFFTTREVGEGTGLGLSVCHGIIAEHGGRIYAESKPRKGATFIVELPTVIEPEQLKLAEPAAEESDRVARAKILVVDDEPAVLKFLSQVLTDEGHEVETVDNADAALDRVESQRYSVILLDIKMPRMSGIELYKRFKGIAASLASRVVFITGDVIGARTTAFLSKTKAPYITKPFTTAELKKEIDRILTQGTG